MLIELLILWEIVLIELNDKNSLFDRGSIGEMGLCAREPREHRKIIENHLPYSSNSFSLVIFSRPLARIVTTGGEKPTFLARVITFTSPFPLCYLCTLKSRITSFVMDYHFGNPAVFKRYRLFR
jgi:hypothetical protein